MSDRPNSCREPMLAHRGVTRVATGALWPEEEALLLAIRAAADPTLLARLRGTLASPALDWDALWRLGEQQQVQPLLARVLGDPVVVDRVPDRIRDLVRATRLQMTLHNLAARAELERLGRLLAARGIPAVPLKGVHLALRLFGALDARRCGDIDILVPEADRGAAWDLLRASGYEPAEAVKPGVLSHPFHGVPLVRVSGGVRSVVELHWKLTDPRFVDVDYEQLWARIREASPPGGPLYALPPEDLLLFLALHLPKHDAGHLRLLADVDRLVRLEAARLDWDMLLVRGRAWRVSDLLSFSLGAATVLLDTPVPADVLARLRPPGWKRGLVSLLAGPRTMLRPPAPDHLRANRSRLAYCLMLQPGRTIARAYWHNLMGPSRVQPSESEDRDAGLLRRVGTGLAWTTLALWSAVRDHSRAGRALGPGSAGVSGARD